MTLTRKEQQELRLKAVAMLEKLFDPAQWRELTNKEREEMILDAMTEIFLCGKEKEQ